MDGKYMAIEGNVAAGKTLLASFLKDRYGAEFIEDHPSENPFVSKFYRDIRGFAFQAQVFFLLTRYEQQRGLAQIDLFKRCVVSDYLFAKEWIYALVNLSDEELSLYRKIIPLLEATLPLPDVVVYLQASTPILIDRIKERGRFWERNIVKEYIEELNEEYNRYFFHYDRTALLVVNVDGLDFSKSKEDMEDIAVQIEGVDAKVTRYYVPAGRRKSQPMLDEMGSV